LTALDRDDRVEAYHRFSLRPYVLLTKASVLKIGEELDAEQVLFGEFDLQPVPDSAVKSRGSLLITARLLDLKHYKNGPEFREVGALEDLAALQEHLAWQVLHFVKSDAAPTEAEFRKRHPAVRVDAIESYIRGLLATTSDEKHRLYTQAVRLDSRYSQPCFHLGRLFWRKKEYKSAAEWFQKVAPGDAHYNEASFFLGLSRYYAGDYAEAQSGIAPQCARSSGQLPKGLGRGRERSGLSVQCRLRTMEARRLSSGRSEFSHGPGSRSQRHASGPAAGTLRKAKRASAGRSADGGPGTFEDELRRERVPPVEGRAPA
jgi:tetratricopeptide (TPR) repeat protein